MNLALIFGQQLGASLAQVCCLKVWSPLSFPRRRVIWFPSRLVNFPPEREAIASLTAAAVLLLVAAPWHILAMVRNPPHFVWTLHSGPGEYKGFLWFFFINEQLLRFLNLRYPRDYNTGATPLFLAFPFDLVIS